jgi:hypothetical protein
MAKSYRDAAASTPPATPQPTMSSSRPIHIAHQLCFVLRGNQEDLACLHGMAGSQLASAMSALLMSRLALPEPITVVDAMLMRPPAGAASHGTTCRYFLRVASLAHASAIVRHRHKLKGSSLAILDQLCPEERKAHGQLWPTFIQARAQGWLAQFQRARLFVSKTWPSGRVMKFEVKL